MPLPSYARFTYNNSALGSNLTRCGNDNLFEFLEYKHELGGKEELNFHNGFEWANYHKPVIATLELNKHIPLFYELLFNSDSKYFDKIEIFWTCINQDKSREEVYLVHTLEPVKIRKIKLWFSLTKSTSKEHNNHLVS
jgi:type VI protein secretion system component Hcp